MQSPPKTPPPWLINGIGHVRAGLGNLLRAAIPSDVATIIHDWEEASALQILRNVRTVVAPSGKPLLGELVLAEDKPWHPGMLIDLEMLVTAGGRERTASEYAELLTAKGFRQVRVAPTAGPMSVVEAVPA